MQWQDEGVLLNLRAHGEGHAVAEIITRKHGRHLGLVRGGLGRRMRPVLQAGNSLSVNWNARLESHLGNFTLDLLTERTGQWLHIAAPLHGISTLASHLHLLAEREPHPDIYDALVMLLSRLDDPSQAKPLFIRFEMLLLHELGFGLDLSQCAVSGTDENLTYVSPRTGRAVGEQAAAPYKEKLLQLPAFLLHEENIELSPQHILEGAKLTGYFLEQHLYAARNLLLPEARARFFKQ